MAAQTRTEGERIANLEGQIAHLATKADIGALDAKIEAIRAEMSTMKWILGHRHSHCHRRHRDCGAGAEQSAWCLGGNRVCACYCVESTVSCIEIARTAWQHKPELKANASLASKSRSLTWRPRRISARLLPSGTH